MKDLNKRSDMNSKRALKKSVHAAERQEGKQDLADRIHEAEQYYYDKYDRGCNCGCEDIMEYLPFLGDGTIGGRFLSTLVKLNLMQSWKKDPSMSDLYYSVATTPKGIIASVYVKPDSK